MIKSSWCLYSAQVYCCESLYANVTTLRWLSLCHCKSVVCHVRTTYWQSWSFWQYFAPSNSLETRVVWMLKFWKFEGGLGDVQVKWKVGMKNCHFWTNILSRKQYNDQLQWKANRNYYAICWIVPCPVTAERNFEVTIFFNVKYLKNVSVYTEPL